MRGNLGRLSPSHSSLFTSRSLILFSFLFSFSSSFFFTNSTGTNSASEVQGRRRSRTAGDIDQREDFLLCSSTPTGHRTRRAVLLTELRLLDGAKRRAFKGSKRSAWFRPKIFLVIRESLSCYPLPCHTTTPTLLQHYNDDRFVVQSSFYLAPLIRELGREKVALVGSRRLSDLCP